MTMATIRSLPTDPERLTTAQLLTLHERLFAPLSRQAKKRMLSAPAALREERGWRGMDGLAA